MVCKWGHPVDSLPSDEGGCTLLVVGPKFCKADPGGGLGTCNKAWFLTASYSLSALCREPTSSLGRAKQIHNSSCVFLFFCFGLLVAIVVRDFHSAPGTRAETPMRCCEIMESLQ
eukprot:5533506-Pleurochrysis_carterae.AAC.1